MLKKIEKCPICQKEIDLKPIMFSGRPIYQCPSCSSTIDVQTVWQIAEEEKREETQKA